MNESNYNFRNALKEIKATKKAKIMFEADQVLRGIIGKIGAGEQLYLEEALNQIIFVQDDKDIDAYIKNITESANSNYSIIRVATYSCEDFNDAANLMIAIRSKLQQEQFVIEDYSVPSNVRGTKGFIVDTRDR